MARQVLDQISAQQAPSIDPDLVPQLSDRTLYRLADAFSGKTFDYRDRLWGLLPEIRRRKLYRRFNFSSFEEYTEKFCSMTAATRREFLRVYSKVEDLPRCKALFVSGKVGWTKFQAICADLKPSSDAFWAEQVQVLSKDALKKLRTDLERSEEGSASEPTAGDIQPANTFTSLRFRSAVAEEFHQLLKLRRKTTGSHLSQSEGLQYLLRATAAWERHDAEADSDLKLPPQVSTLVVHDDPLSKRLYHITRKGPVDTGQSYGVRYDDSPEEIRLSKLFDQAKEAAARYEARLHRSKAARSYTVNSPASERKASRYIPKAVRDFHAKRSGGYCTVRGCCREMDILHHLERFSRKPVPWPELLVPLCRVHHLLVHAGVIANEDEPAELWRCCRGREVRSANEAARAQVDKKWRGYQSSSRLDDEREDGGSTRPRPENERRGSGEPRGP